MLLKINVMRYLKNGCILLFCLLGCTGNASAQSLKDVVVVVSPVYSPETAACYSELSVSLARNGYISSARMLKARTQGDTFGSGFAVMHQGKYYVLTNKHVVEYAESVTFRFLQGTDTVTCKNAVIVAVDEALDLALIALPAEKKIETALSLTSASPQDGMEVWSAGFPTLGGQASWQLGKGIISNSAIQREELADPQITPVIQHTAQVDRGSSGGPLLVIADNALGYEVIGINTWKASGRDAANFAIPAAAILKFVAASLDGSAPGVEERAKALASGIKSPKDIVPYIADDFVYSMPADNFYVYLNSAPENVKDEAVGYLRMAEPVEAIKLVIANEIFNLIQKGNGTLAYAGAETTGNEAVVAMSDAEGKFNTTWVYQYGHWHLKDYKALAAQKARSRSVAHDYEVERAWYLTVGFPLNNHEGILYELGYDRYIEQYFTYGCSFTLGKTILRQTPSDDEPEPESDKYGYFGVNINLGGELPIKLSPVYLIPYVKGSFGLDMGEYSCWVAGVRPGVKLAIRAGDNTFLYTALEYRYKHKSGHGYDNEPLGAASFLGVSLGINF
jgi:serine protease Do